MGDTKRQSAARSRQYRLRRAGGVVGRRGERPGTAEEAIYARARAAHLSARDELEAAHTARRMIMRAEFEALEDVHAAEFYATGTHGTAEESAGRERLITAQARHAALREAVTAADTRLDRAKEREHVAVLEVARALDVANRAAGAAGRVHVGYTSSEAQARTRALLGAHATEHTFRAITGAHPGESVMIEPSEDHTGAVHITYRAAGRRQAGFLLYRDHTGRIVMDVHLVVSGTKTAGSGRELITAVRTLRDIGVDYINTNAAGNPGSPMNGYYTWALLGATGSIGDYPTRAAAQAFFHDPTISRVEQVMDKPGGPQWWKQHGAAFNATMSLGVHGRTGAAIERFDRLLSRRKAT